MRFEVLGHLRARRGVDEGDSGAEAVLGGPKQRLVLALLLARPNEVVSTDRLIDGVWGDDVPGTARHTLQSYVSELRKVIGPALERAGQGYSLRVDQHTLDALEFESLVSEGVSRVGADPGEAAVQLRHALDLWHGPPFGDFEHHAGLAVEVTRLEELRLTAVEHLMRTELALGRNHAVIGALEQMTQQHPYREELRALHMLALYRSGRQADALRAYQRTRRVLADDLGIDPSPALSRLEEQILVQDPALDLVDAPAAPDLATASAATENPYKGLQAFREDDRDAFFGRRELCDQIVAALAADARMVAVVGPSGSGKSSVILAGVVPACRARYERGRLLVATMQPGAHPFADLEVALARAADHPPGASPTPLHAGPDGLLRAALRHLPDDDSRLLLVIDQFEELFTLVGDADRARFLQAVATAASDPRQRVQILLATRADFFDRPLLYREFARLVTQHVVHVLPLSSDELEAAATEPARRVGLAIEPRLLAALIGDVQDQPHALPLFQYALTELYDRSDGTTLTHAGYQAFGGLRRAVTNRADELYASLDPEQQEAARQLFLRLVAVAGDAEGRRRIPASELTALEVDVVALQTAIEAFGRHRLLTLDRDPSTGGPTVEVAHEALLREWPLLRHWLDDARTDLRVHRGFALAADEWTAAGRDPDYLLSGGRLAEYERWAATTTLRLTSTEREFLDDAVARRRVAEAAEEERRAAETKLRRRSRRRAWALAGALAALVGVVAGVLVTSGGSDGPTIGMFGFQRGDYSIDTLALDGFERAARERDFEPAVIGTTVTDQAGSLADLAHDAELVIVGFLGENVLTEDVVLANPDTTWAVFDPPADPIPGVASFSFAVHEGAFLVGAAAALESRTGKVGFVGGSQYPQIEAFRAGFEAGALAADPDVQVLAAYVGAGPFLAFADPERGRLTATSLYQQGVDVIFHAAGGSGYGVFEAADHQSDVLGRQLWAIGVDSDQYLEAPETIRAHILTSMVKRFDLAVFQTVLAYLDGELEPVNRVFTLADGGVGFSRSGGHLAASTIARVESFEAEIASGGRVVPHVPHGPLEPPLGLAEPVPVTVTWDGTSCRADGPTDWRVGQVVRFDVTNTSGGAAQVWAQPPDVVLPLVGVEVLPGGRASAALELLDEQPVVVRCYPVIGGRAAVAEGVEATRPIEPRGVAAGTYTTDAVEPHLTYTVPEGWRINERPGLVTFSPPNWTTFAPISVWHGVRAADQSCALVPEPGVGTGAIAIADWLAARPGLDAGAPVPVELGGLRGRTVDLTLREDWPTTCELPGVGPGSPTLIRPATDALATERWIAARGWQTRYHLLDVPGGGTLAVVILVPSDRTGLDQVDDLAAPVLQSFAFEGPGSA